MKPAMEGGYKRVKTEGQILKRTPFKVCSADRTIRKGVVSSSFLDLIETCIDKFNTGTYDVKLVLNEDGTEIDEDYFEILEPNTVLVLLRQKEVWTPEGSSSRPANLSAVESSISQDQLKVIKRKRVDTSPDILKQEGTSTKVKQKPQEVSCILGWKHYSFKDKKYLLQKSTTEYPSSGQKNIRLPKSFCYDETLKYLTDLFFKDGQNEKGNLNKMRFCLGNSKGEEVSGSNFSLGAYVEGGGTKLTRIYLLTKPQFPLRRRSSDPDVEADLPDVSETKFVPKPGTSLASVLGRPAIGTGASVSALPKVTVQTHVKPTDGVKPSPVKVHSVSPGTTKKKCPLCFKRDRDAFIMPCGDSICMTCGAQLIAYGEGCPTCRGPVEKVRLIYQ